MEPLKPQQLEHGKWSASESDKAKFVSNFVLEPAERVTSHLDGLVHSPVLPLYSNPRPPCKSQSEDSLLELQFLLQLCLSEKDMPPHPWIIFHKLQLLGQRSRVLSLDIEIACSCVAEKFDQQSCAFLCHCG